MDKIETLLSITSLATAAKLLQELTDYRIMLDESSDSEETFKEKADVNSLIADVRTSLLNKLS